MSDFGKFVSDEFSRGESQKEAFERAASDACDKLAREPDVNEAVRLILLGGGCLEDVIDVLTIGDYSARGTHERVRECFENGAARDAGVV